jgi:predicted enzyme related to lactoylglutathione lyase
MRVSNAAVMHLNHLGLPVRGLRRSQQFYSAYFGFDLAAAQEYADGTVIIRNADGFDLALHPVRQAEPSPAFLQAGFKAAAPAGVRALMERMDADGSPSRNATMKQPTWRSNALTRTATGSRCTGSHCASDDAKPEARLP